MKTNASAFCRMVADSPDISNAAARFGAWLTGAAEATGGFPVELSVHQIRYGFTRAGKDVQGMGGRYETINASISWLEENGHLTTNEGRAIGFGHLSRNFTLHPKS